MHICMYVITGECVYYVHICMCIPVCGCVNVYVREFICLVACYSDTDPFGEIRARCRRFRLVFVVSPIYWRFED